MLYRLFWTAILFCGLIGNSFADDFYWVNNGGNWSDYTNHWATSSGGSIMHTRVPDSSDNVIFDINSFSAADEVVVADTTISCYSMTWSGVANKPEFLGYVNDTLVIAGALYLETTDNMLFNFLGTLMFLQPAPMQNIIVSPQDHSFFANIVIQLNGGEIQLLNDFVLSQKRIQLLDGILNLNGFNLYCRHFNTSSSVSVPVAILTPGLKDIDTVFCNGSLHLSNGFDLSAFDGYIFMRSQSVDSNYISFGNNILDSYLYFTGNKKTFLLSDIHTLDTLNLDISGLFSSGGFQITAGSFQSISPLTRTIELGVSKIFTKSFAVIKTGLTIQSSNADLYLTGADTLSFYSDKSDLLFHKVQIQPLGLCLVSGNMNCDSLIIGYGVHLFLSDESEHHADHFVVSGNCGEYIIIQPFCGSCSECYPDVECVQTKPKFFSATPQVFEYVKLAYIEAQGDFTANNSFDEGGNVSFIINEPAAVSTLYWVGNTGQWNQKDNWATVSGGAVHSCIPTKRTHVVFDANSFSLNDTVTLNDYGYCASMTWTGLSSANFWDGQGKLFMTDSLLFDLLTVADFSGTVVLENQNASDTISIQTNSVQVNADVQVNGLSHWFVTGDFSSTANIEFIEGKLTMSGIFIQAESFSSSSSLSRTLDISASIIDLSGNDTVWNMNDQNLVFDASSSQIAVSGSDSHLKIFKGGDLTYGELHCVSNSIEITGDNTFGLLSLMSNVTLTLESGSNTQMDSLFVSSTCDERVSIISNRYDSPAVLNKLQWDTLYVSDVYLKNIIADTASGKYYEASSSIWSGDVTGWTFPDTLSGSSYYWLGLNQDWNDLSNWTVNSLPATCLPGIMDTVIVDPLYYSGALTDTMLISKNAFCRVFDASLLVTDEIHIILEQNLFVGNALLLNGQTNFSYGYEPDPVEFFEITNGIVLTPELSNFSLNSQDALFRVKLFSSPVLLTDTVFLNSTLYTDTLAGLFVMSGVFDSQQHNIQLGFFESVSESLKEINLEKSNIVCYVGLNFQDNSKLVLAADSSLIQFPGNYFLGGSFYGGGQTYFDAEFSAVIDSLIGNSHQINITGSNTFRVLSINEGIQFRVEKNTTQTIDSALVVHGTCPYPVYFRSTEAGQNYSFVKTNGVVDTTYCARIKDMTITPGGYSRLGSDDGNNTGWTFDPTAAATASFIMPYPSCIDEDLTFVNTSSSMVGGMTNLDFFWEITDVVDTNSVDFNYTFIYQGDYEIVLTAIDTITKCSDVYRDTLNITDHSVLLSTSEPGLAICAGDSVTFTASSNQANQFTFYLNNIPLNLGFDTINVYTTDSLENLDTVRVEAIYNGCAKSSIEYVFTVNPLPIVVLSCSDPDTTICAGDEVSFTASGALQYEFFINGVSTGPVGVQNVFTTSTLADSSLISVIGYYPSTGCYAPSIHEYLVRVIPNPSILITSSVDPAVLCQGDSIMITATGGVLYEYFVNGISQGPPSINDQMNLTGLVDGDVVTVVGYSASGCYSVSNSIDIVVNPSPSPVLTTSEIDQMICVGDQVEFFGSGANEFQFFVEGISQGGFATANSFLTTTLNHGETVTMQGRIGSCVRSAPQLLTFQVFPVINLNASATEICQNDSITFTASGDTIYQFFIDGIAVTSQSPLNTYTAGNLSNGQTVTVEGTTGACLPSGYTITVNSLPVVQMSCSDPDTTICDGDNITFTASGAQQYEFFIDGSSQGAPSLLSFFTTNALINGQIVSVTGTSAEGCISQSVDFFTVTVHPYPVVGLAVDDPATQLCAGDTFTFTASGADEYEFFISGISQGVSTNPVFETSSLFNNATVTVNGITNGCAAQAPQSYTYTVFNLPIVGLTPLTPVSVCDGDLISLEATGATDYEFFVNSVSQGVPSPVNVFSSTILADGDVISVVGYQNICSNETTTPVTVNVNQVPNLVFSTDLNPLGICYGDTVTFTATGAMTYVFYLDGLQYGGVDSTGIIQISNLEDGQTVTVTAFNNACFLVSDTVFTANVNYVNTVLVSSDQNNVFCEGDQIVLTASGADLYEFFLDGVSLGVPSATSVFNLGTILNGQNAWVNGTDLSNSCVGQSNVIWFFVMDQPQITVIPDIQFCEGDSVTLISDHISGNQWYLNSTEIPAANLQQYIAYEGGTFSLTVSLGDQGGVYSVGNNGYGQFGDGTVMPSFDVVQALTDHEMIQISSGRDFMAALDIAGDVWTWGNNQWGNHGVGTYSPSSIPLHVASLSNISSVVCGYDHVIALRSDSTLVSWGRNTSGQLGYGNFAASNFPMPVMTLNGIISVCAGESHSLALRNDGTVWSWGANNLGQLGDGSLITRNSPVQVAGLDSIVYIAAGAFHSIAVRQDGSVWVWGSNQQGQLGLNNYSSTSVAFKNPYINNIVSASAGKDHTLFLNNKGYVLSCGSNADGQLGIPAVSELLVPQNTGIKNAEFTICGFYISFAIRADRSVWVWGQNNSGQSGNGTIVNVTQPERVEQLFGIKGVAAGQSFSSFLTTEAHTCFADEVTLIMDSVPDVIITQVGNTLTTVDGESWQWYLNGSPIPGATTQSITIVAQGIYTVMVTFSNGCTGMSDEFPFGVHVEEWISEEHVSVLPNPSNGAFDLVMNMPGDVLGTFETYTIWSVTGSRIGESSQFHAQPVQRMNLMNLAPGMYYLVLHSNGKDLRVKLIISE
jgi:alpha-tubulin suppressor-like RCC1 family protein